MNNRTLRGRVRPPSLMAQAGAQQPPQPPAVQIHKHERKYAAVDPSVFAGPAGWVFIHSAAANYDPAVPGMTEGFKMLIKGFAAVFPCERCRNNLVKHLKELPLEQYLGNRDELFLWSYLMHDKVNKLKGVSSPPLLEIKKYYFESLDLQCSNCA